MSAPVFRQYDRAALDREYDNQNKPGFDFAGFQRDCEQASMRARAELDGVLDVPYGATPAEKLDIFKASRPNAPVHVFFHGGYWRGGKKDHFSYVARGLVAAGVTTVVVGYALIPTVRLDELVRQCRRALAWVADHIGAHGGDATRLSISGHSAGGHLVAMMLSGDWLADVGRPCPPLTSACALSGIFELEPIRQCFLNDVLDLSPADVAAFSPAQLPRRDWTPLTIVVGGDEGPEYLRQSMALRAAWSGPLDTPRLVVLPDTNHFTMRGRLGEPSSDVVRLALGG